MKGRIEAVPGQWYQDRATGDTFQVVSVDEQDRALEIQYTDGALDEMSMDEWAASALSACDQPEDWVGPYDDLESDDIGMPEATSEPHAAEIPIERALLEIEEQRVSPANDSDD
ncbi:MAG: DUF6763 family protein [Steroidobacterales bacterium]